MQQLQPGTVKHSRISSLMISRRLTELLRDIKFGLHVTGSGRGNLNIFGCALRASI